MKREASPISQISITTKDDRSIWARFYWSKNSGTYGHQVITEYNVGDAFQTAKTNGCGYCKESSAFADFTKEVFPELDYRELDGLGGSTMKDLMWNKTGIRPSRDVEMSIEEFKTLVTK